MSIRDDKDLFRKQAAHSTAQEHKNADGKLSGGDPRDVCFEIYNRGGETITFRNYHPEKHKMCFLGKSPLEWNVLECKPGEWVFLPHGYYLGSVPSGNKEISVTKNYGSSMFKGEKYPSRPDAQKVRVFTK